MRAGVIGATSTLPLQLRNLRRDHGWWLGLLVVRLHRRQNGVVSAQEIDQYLDALEEPKRT